MAFNIGGAIQGAIGGAGGGPLGAIAGGLAGGFLGGGSKGPDYGEMMDRQENFQREVGQHSVQWRVADAKAAGIHPLYALGASLPSFQGATPVGDFGSPRPDLVSAGQDIGRAVEAYASGRQRMQARLDALQVERGELENQVLAAQLAKMTQPSNPVPFPDLEQGVSTLPVGWVSDPRRYADPRVDVMPLGQSSGPFGVVENKPAEMVTTLPGRPGNQAGVNPDIAWHRTDDGSWVYQPSEKMKIDDLGSSGSVQWLMRNRVVPALPWSPARPLPPQGPPKGSIGWLFNPMTGKFWPAYPGSGAEWSPYFVPDSDGRR